MTTQKWIGGANALVYSSAGFSTELNSLAPGNAVLAANQLDNSSSLDLFADISISLGSVTTGAGTPYVGVYLYPLNQDNSTYGDGNFSTAATGPPPSNYFVGAIPCQVSATGAVVGTARGVLLPPGKFKYVLYNNSGATLAGSANTVNSRTYDLQLQ